MTQGSPVLVEVLRTLSEGGSLDGATTRRAMGAILSGEATPVQVGAFLAALRVKGETIEEIAGLVRGMREHAVPVRPRRDDLIDLCGTGGDGSQSFNISTAASLVVAACGVPVAKHGNRSASSLCGSADVLERLGVPIELGPEEAAKSIDELGFAFLFARTYHPAMRHVAPVRRELGVRTVFNILGPLTNPAGARKQLVGVYADHLRRIVVNVLRELGSETVWAVHGAEGLDEISIAGPTFVTRLSGGTIDEIEISPEDADLPRHPLESLRGGDGDVNARLMDELLAGAGGPIRDAVLLNAAAALVVHGTAGDLRAGSRAAREAIDAGRARKLLAALRER